jgi:putative phosphoribosyl transferase
MTDATLRDQVVRVTAGSTTLEGNLCIPDEAAGVVLFAHGSGSSRHSPRNRFVAEELQRRRLATLLIDLLTHEEEQEDVRTARLRFDIRLLAHRLVTTTHWLGEQARTRTLKIGYFGASTGAAAALVAAADRRKKIAAIVSRGGRPDLAGSALPHVAAPTLLIVGGDDVPVLSLNRQAFEKLNVEKRLHVVPGATHLFEEPGTLEEAAQVAGDWFQTHLS